MVTSASARDRFYRKIESLLGPEDDGFLMDALPPAGWADVATRSDVRDVRSELLGVRSELRAEIKTEMAELRSDTADLRAEMREGFARTVSRDELGELLRLHVDARVGAVSRWWLFSTMGMQAATIAGVLAALRL